MKVIKAEKLINYNRGIDGQSDHMKWLFVVVVK